LCRMDKIVAGARKADICRRSWRETAAADVYGEATAGVDLGKIEPAQIEVNGRTVTVAMPAAEIFATRIDNERRASTHARRDCSRDRIQIWNRMFAERQNARSRRRRSDGGILQAATTNRAYDSDHVSAKSGVRASGGAMKRVLLCVFFSTVLVHAQTNTNERRARRNLQAAG